MARDMPLELLRTFVATVETGSMAKAARLVERTPSAVSLQMTRLFELVGHPLFRRERRVLTLTPAGETLLVHAREILDANDRALAVLTGACLEGPVRFGTVQDLADTLLPRALAQFARGYPGIQLHVHVDTSKVLLDEARAGALDFVVCFESRRAPRPIRREPLVWLGHRALARVDPLPVAVLQPDCFVCDRGLEALKAAGRRCDVVLRTPSLSGLRAALEAGLAVGSRTPLLQSGSIVVLDESDGLPPLGEVGYSLHVPRPLSPAARRVAALVKSVVAGTGAPAEPAAPVAAVHPDSAA
jgi:DNA-binding transcriptional LysR family regulator